MKVLKSFIGFYLFISVFYIGVGWGQDLEGNFVSKTLAPISNYNCSERTLFHREFSYSDLTTGIERQSFMEVLKVFKFDLGEVFSPLVTFDEYTDFIRVDQFGSARPGLAYFIKYELYKNLKEYAKDDISWTNEVVEKRGRRGLRIRVSNPEPVSDPFLIVNLYNNYINPELGLKGRGLFFLYLSQIAFSYPGIEFSLQSRDEKVLFSKGYKDLFPLEEEGDTIFEVTLYEVKPLKMLPQRSA